jgi:hypothetical protein
VTIDEKINLLKDAVRLLNPDKEEVFFDCHDEEGFSVSLKDGADELLFEGTEPMASFEASVDLCIKKVDEAVQTRLKMSKDLAERLELYKNPVEVAPPEKEGKKK